MRIILVLISLFILFGCNKPDPNPENKDEIYADLNNQLGLLNKELESEEKALEEHKKVLAEVTPQTGQIKYAQKRVFDSEARINKQKQNIEWLKIHIEKRLKETRKSYLKAFKSGNPWPDKTEFEMYKAEMKLLRAKREWNVKDRIAESGFGSDQKKKENEKESKKEEKKE